MNLSVSAALLTHQILRRRDAESVAGLAAAVWSFGQLASRRDDGQDAISHESSRWDGFS